MWTLIAKNVLRTKLYEDCSRILLQTPKGKPSYQKYFSLSRNPCLCSARVAQAVQTFSISPAIRKVETLEKKQFICVHWEDGSESLYPSVWLRDNCQCPNCFLHSAKARKLPLENLDINIKVKDVTLTEQKKKVNIIWPDDHTSEFDAKWLKKRCFSDQARAKTQEELFFSGLGRKGKYNCSFMWMHFIYEREQRDSRGLQESMQSQNGEYTSKEMS